MRLSSWLAGPMSKHIASQSISHSVCRDQQIDTDRATESGSRGVKRFTSDTKIIPSRH